MLHQHKKLVKARITSMYSSRFDVELLIAQKKAAFRGQPLLILLAIVVRQPK